MHVFSLDGRMAGVSYSQLWFFVGARLTSPLHVPPPHTPVGL